MIDFRICKGEAVLLIDVAPIGPDYLPGHAHADTLSYELSLYGKRVLVNSGTSRYGSGPKRDWERSTAAHNTVEVDGQSSSETWSGFRVARRAYPFDVLVEQKGVEKTEKSNFWKFLRRHQICMVWSSLIPKTAKIFGFRQLSSSEQRFSSPRIPDFPWTLHRTFIMCTQ